MSKSKKLTVCILTYNRAFFLKIAIQKILEQTYTDYDLIIVDDCSPDCTPEVVNSFDDERITYIRNETNLGFNENYNKALSLARSPYVLLTHDDDEMTPTFLQREVEVLDKHPDVVMVTTNTESIDQNSHSLKEREIEIQEDVEYSPVKYIDACLNDGIGLCCPTFMFRLSFLQNSGIIFRDVGPGSDVIICLETNLEHTIYLIADPLFKFRAHQGQDHVQLKNCMRADLTKHINTWRVLKGKTNTDHHLPQIAYNIAHAFPLHVVADAIDTDKTSIPLAKALSKCWEALRPDEKTIVASTPKFKLMALVANFTPEKTHPELVNHEIKANQHHAALMAYNDKLLLSWLRSKQPIASFLQSNNIKRVTLWGVGVVSQILKETLQQSGISTVSIIDNDPRKVGHRFLGLPIQSYDQAYLDQRPDAIITCIESYHDLFIRQQIDETPPKKSILVYSWKELATFQSSNASLTAQNV